MSSSNKNDSQPLQRMDDVLVMKAAATTIQKLAVAAKINKNQCMLVYARMSTIYRTVLMLPEPRPSPRLLSVFRSAELIMKMMASEEAIEMFLPRRFNAVELFAELFQKIKAVWSLQSTLQWPKEEQQAAEKDADHGMKLIKELLKKVRDGPHSGNGGIGGSDFPTTTTSSREPEIGGCGMGHDDNEIPIEANPDDTHHRAGGGDMTFDPTSGSALKPIAYIEEFLERARRGRKSFVTHTAQQHQDLSPEDAEELQTYFRRRRQMNGWKLQFLELAADPRCSINTELLPPQDMASTEVSGSDSRPSNKKSLQPTLQVAPRWSILDGFSFLGHEVVIKELSDPKFLTPATVEAFVLDASIRYGWCHPNVINVEGAYCEKFRTSCLSSLDLRGGVGGGGGSAGSLDQYQPQRGNSAALASQSSGGGSATFSSGSAPVLHDGRESTTSAPYLVLGLVMSRVPKDFLPLNYLLFQKKHRFSLGQTIEIMLQVADAMQYVHFHAENVSNVSVVSAWSMLAPSNVFVRLPSSAGNREAEFPMESASQTAPSPSATPEVLISPHLFSELSPVNRWRPHAAAYDPVCFSLTELFLALLTNGMPYAAVTDQRVLHAIVGEGLDAPLGFEEIPAKVPPVVANFAVKGFALRGQQDDDSNAGRRFDGLQQFRKELYKLQEEVDSSSFMEDLPGSPNAKGPLSKPFRTEFIESEDHTLARMLTDDYGTMVTAIGGSRQPSPQVTGQDLPLPSSLGGEGEAAKFLPLPGTVPPRQSMLEKAESQFGLMTPANYLD